VSTQIDQGSRLPPPTSEESDLGFGRVLTEQVHGRFLNRDGVSRTYRYGLGSQYGERFYLGALSIGWLPFIGFVVGAMLLVNGIFALAYVALGSGALQGADASGVDDAFLRALSFSVGVFTTNGTGAIHAVGPSAHWLVVIESLLGPVMFLAAGGLLVARLTRPRMRLRFSESAVVAPYQDGRGLMFRMVNAQRGEVSAVRVSVTLVRYEQVDGRRERHFHQLDLERNFVEFFPLHLTVVHPIDADSPLRGATPDALRDSQAELLVQVSAHEETFSTRVTARSSYLWEDIRWDAKFANVFTSGPEGAVAIDVERLNRMERLAEGTTSVPAAPESSASR
jgi:inward rectifier potassium channel